MLAAAVALMVVASPSFGDTVKGRVHQPVEVPGLELSGHAKSPDLDIMNAAWEHIDGCAKRIAIAEVGHPYVTWCGKSDDTAIYRLNNEGVFEQVPGVGNSVVPWPDGSTNYFAVSGNRQLLTFGSMSGISPGTPCAREIGTGQQDVTGTWDWVIECERLADGVNFTIARRQRYALGDDGHPSYQFDQRWPGGAVRVAVGLTDAVAWVINDPKTGGGIYRQSYCKSNDADETVDTNNAFCKSIQPAWEQIPGCATSIGNGGQNRVWVIGCDVNADGEGPVYQYAGVADSTFVTSRWVKRLGHAKEIAVDPDGRPWVVKKDGSIWRWRLGVPAKGQRIESDPAQPGGAAPK